MSNQSVLGFAVGRPSPIAPGQRQANDFKLTPPAEAPVAPVATGQVPEAKKPSGTGSLVATAAFEPKVGKSLSGVFESLPDAKRVQYETAYAALFPGSDA